MKRAGKLACWRTCVATRAEKGPQQLRRAACLLDTAHLRTTLEPVDVAAEPFSLQRARLRLRRRRGQGSAKRRRRRAAVRRAHGTPAARARVYQLLHAAAFFVVEFRREAKWATTAVTTFLVFQGAEMILPRANYALRVWWRWFRGDRL